MNRATRGVADEVLRARIKGIAHTHRRYGYRRITQLLSGEETVNHKRVYRIYCEEGLQVRRPPRHRLVVFRQPLPVPSRRDERCSMDFITDALVDGRRYRVLAVLDEYTRECKALFAGTSIPS